MKFLNLTPHQITIVEGESSTVYPVDGPAPRLAVEREALGQIDGISVVRSTMGEPTGLPEPREGVIAEGKIVGAKGLCAGPGLAKSLRAAVA